MNDSANPPIERDAAAERTALIGIIAILAIGLGLAWAGAQGSIVTFGLPLFALCGAFAFAVQWIVFVPSFLARTEHYFDLTGSITYVSTVLGTAVLAGSNPRSWLIAGLVAIWALRLGTFLFIRVRQDGKDGRFDAIKQSFVRFLMAWTLQGLWVFLTLAAALAAMTSAQQAPLGLLAWLGVALWVAGFAIEAVADAQKRAFKQRTDRDKDFITDGLWAWSRHPNYFGEILLWFGVALIASEVLSGWQWVTMISPIFVYVLLTRISGVPLLEFRGKKRWGSDPEYQAYRERVPVLFPRPPRAA